MQVAIASEVKKAVDASQTQLLTNMQSLMDTNFKSFRTSIESTQKELSSTQISKIEENLFGSYKFKRHGNEARYRGNIKVMAKLREADDNLERQSITMDNVRQAREKIAEGIELLTERQKLIKIADSSPIGWKVVAEYEANPIADDSDDEKKIWKAQSRAEKKAKESRKFRGRGRPHPYGRGDYNSRPTDAAPAGPAVRRPGKCFDCGGKGHWARECTKKENEKEISTIYCNNSEFSKNSDFQNDTVSFSQVDNSNTNLILDHFTHQLPSGMSNSPVGQLKACVGKWVNTGANAHIVDVIRSGYKIPFKTIPADVCLKNNMSSLENPNFAKVEIQELLRKGCISERETPPRVVNPLTVVYNKSGKPRLVLDCRHINPHLFKFKYRYEDSEVARDIFEKGDYVFTYDLKSAYHHISIFSEHRTYLGFSWDFEGLTRYFVFNVLPFGLSTAGFIFSKVTRHFVKHIRSKGHKVIMYLDDGLAGASDFQESLSLSAYIRQELISFGYLLANEKCDWTPKQIVVWLGFEWNFITGVLKVSTDRMGRVLTILEDILGKVNKGQIMLSAKLIASFVGQIISCKSVLGDLVRFKTRFLYFCVETRASWFSKIKLTPEAITELRFWFEQILHLNSVGTDLTSVNLSEMFDYEMFSDASDSGYGGYEASMNFQENSAAPGQQGQGQIPQTGSDHDVSDSHAVTGVWSRFEAGKSSTWRELESVHRVIRSKSDVLSNTKVKVISDNKNVSHILQVGSKKPDLQAIAVNIHDICDKKHIAVQPIWVPRDQNQMADSLSRVPDKDDWGLNEKVFHDLQKRYGAHEIDLFATHYNTQCQKFYSKFWCPGSSGVDAFAFSWSEGNNGLVPPPKLITKALQKCVCDRARTTIVIPEWKSAPFWPLISLYSSRIRDIHTLPRGNLIVSGRTSKGIFCKRPLDFNMLAIRFEFSP